MSLTKGFLRPKTAINRNRVITGIILGTAFSFGLNGLFYYLRESLRLLTSEYGERLLIILTPQENFYYNLFYGAIASIIGFYVFIKFVFENSIARRNPKLKLRQRHILNEQCFFSWLFLFAFGKTVSIIGLWYLTISTQFDISYLKEFWILFVLIPLVLFLNIWSSILRLTGKRGYKYMLYSFLYISVLSLLYGKMNLNDYQQMDDNIKKKSVVLSYCINEPQSQSHNRIYRISLATDLYIINDSTIFWKDALTGIRLDEISDYVNSEKKGLYERERDELLVNLHIDKNVKLSFVNKIKLELRKSKIDKILYSTGLKNSIYPSYYSPYKNWGIGQNLYPHYDQILIDFLDSAEQIDFSKYTIRLPKSPMYRINSLGEYNRIEIRISEVEALLNKQKTSKDRLKLFVSKFIGKYSPNFVIIYTPSSDITYGRYIEYLDLLHTEIDKLRNDLSLEIFGIPFENGGWNPEFDSIRSRYPKNILEWTNEEKRLLELINKSR